MHAAVKGFRVGRLAGWQGRFMCGRLCQVCMSHQGNLGQQGRGISGKEGQVLEVGLMRLSGLQ